MTCVSENCLHDTEQSGGNAKDGVSQDSVYVGKNGLGIGGAILENLHRVKAVERRTIEPARLIFSRSVGVGIAIACKNASIKFLTIFTMYVVRGAGKRI